MSWSLQLHTGSNVAPPHANDDQTRKAAALIKRFDLKDFSVFQFANPGISFCKSFIESILSIFELSVVCILFVLVAYCILGH